MAHRIEMLGTGNAFLPNGRQHSFAIFDGCHIIDAPPTALAGLRRAGYSVADIRTIFVTHIHGDHVFGFPFLLLERKYISDREGQAPLRVVGSPSVRVRLTELCHLAFPGSLEGALESIEWVETPTGETSDGWSWKRFEVHHDETVDPYGYKFVHSDGASFVHSGDSGPCDALYEAIGEVPLALLEMGFPDWVESTHHHKPKDIEELAQRCDTILIITHTFVDDQSEHQPILTDQLPRHPNHVHHAWDGMDLNWSNGHWNISIR